MKFETNTKVSGVYYLLLAILVFMACIGLGYIDHETQTLGDLFTAQNMMALFLYFLPAYALNLLFLYLFFKKKRGIELILISFSLGTISGFAMVMTCLYLLLKR